MSLLRWLRARICTWAVIQPLQAGEVAIRRLLRDLVGIVEVCLRLRLDLRLDLCLALRLQSRRLHLVEPLLRLDNIKVKMLRRPASSIRERVLQDVFHERFILQLEAQASFASLLMVWRKKRGALDLHLNVCRTGFIGLALSSMSLQDAALM